MKAFIFFAIILISTYLPAKDTNTTTHSYYYKGELTYLTKVVEVNQTITDENNDTNITVKKPTLTYHDSIGNPITITNRLIVKFNTRDINISRTESDYNITQVKQRRRTHIFTVPDIENVLGVAKAIYENEDVKYAQPSFIKK
jgi:hypothetical protein